MNKLVAVSLLAIFSLSQKIYPMQQQEVDLEAGKKQTFYQEVEELTFKINSSCKKTETKPTAKGKRNRTTKQTAPTSDSKPIEAIQLSNESKSDLLVSLNKEQPTQQETIFGKNPLLLEKIQHNEPEQNDDEWSEEEAESSIGTPPYEAPSIFRGIEQENTISYLVNKFGEYTKQLINSNSELSPSQQREIKKKRRNIRNDLKKIVNGDKNKLTELLCGADDGLSDDEEIDLIPARNSNDTLKIYKNSKNKTYNIIPRIIEEQKNTKAAFDNSENAEKQYAEQTKMLEEQLCEARKKLIEVRTKKNNDFNRLKMYEIALENLNKRKQINYKKVEDHQKYLQSRIEANQQIINEKIEALSLLKRSDFDNVLDYNNYKEQLETSKKDAEMEKHKDKAELAVVTEQLRRINLWPAYSTQLKEAGTAVVETAAAVVGAAAATASYFGGWLWSSKSTEDKPQNASDKKE